ncbi:hypothetical protein [Specibacter cremeus]|uniref:hypothetical protein n=1 Tax=Specibacter cremeus TaxID=1629051 RepID=UPI000F790F19|nr:hypothetical protein [Specibacter cremeus]
MSQAARRPANLPATAVAGSNALAPVSAPDHFPDHASGPAPRRRTPLAVVPAPARRGKTPVVVFLFGLLVLALAAVLVINVSVSQGQYELVALKAHQDDLAKSNQDLEQKLGAATAPQNLVERAKGLGMVPATSMGQINADTGTVSGNPQPAKAGTEGLAVIPPAAIDTPAEMAPSNVDAAAAAAGNDVSDNAAATREAVRDTAAKEAARKIPARKIPAAPAAVTPDLHGGSIPAPSQKAS